jgi:aldehyde dehydrogenase (NAD(P)+)
VPATIAEFEPALRALRQGAERWVRMSLGERRALLGAVRASTLAAASAWVEAACAYKGIDPHDPVAGEEWSSGPYSVISATSAIEKTLKLVERGRSPIDAVELGTAPGGRTTLKTFPYLPKDIVLPGYEARLWLRPGVTLDDARRGVARALRDPHRKPRVTLVLGAGNITGIPALDVLMALYAEASAVIVKFNPVNAVLAEAMKQAFAPFIELGVLQFVEGGPEVGAALIHHEAIDAVHITGSRHTHDAIVWGNDVDSEKRRAAGTPLLTKPITSELGGVGPAIIVPEDGWTSENVADVARDVVTQRLHNSGFNCVATQIVVIPAAWQRADEFVAAVRQLLAAAPEREAYYPGASSRQLAVITMHPDAAVLGGDPNVPRTLVDILDPEKTDEHLFTVEAFGPILGIVRLPGTREPGDYLDAAVAFANTRLAGTLSAGIHIHPRTRDALGDRFEQAVAELRYGTVGINAWTGTIFGMPGGSWGAFPGHTLADIGSGIGVVHNALLLDPEHVERTVGTGVWKPSPTPLWYVDNTTSHVTARRLTRFAGIDSWAIAAPIGAAAIASYRKG